MNTIKKGFTLIELMIVIAIIAILAAIALPAYQNYVVRSKVSEGIVSADGEKSAVAEAFTNDDIKGVAAAAADYTAANTKTKYIDSALINPANGVITVTFESDGRGGFPTDAKGKTIVLSPFIGTAALAAGLSGVIDWACASATNKTATNRGLAAATAGNMPTKYVPTECK